MLDSKPIFECGEVKHRGTEPEPEPEQLSLGEEP
jgi:hypothetical protein